VEISTGSPERAAVNCCRRKSAAKLKTTVLIEGKLWERALRKFFRTANEFQGEKWKSDTKIGCGRELLISSDAISLIGKGLEEQR
jgi:hypothetical protein